MDIFQTSYDSSIPADLLSFVPSPFAQESDIDPLSKIYQTFQATKASPGIGIFYFLGVMSFWNLKNGVTFKIPNDPANHNPNLWLLILALSGSSKSQQLSLINRLLPDHKELIGNLDQPASLASFIQQLDDDPIRFWVEDEAAKYVKQLETPSNPLAPVKAALLKVKGGDKITYHTKSEGKKAVDNPRLSVVFVNTTRGMINTISQESFYDGFFSRFLVVVAEMGKEFKGEIDGKHPNKLQNLSDIGRSGLKEDLEIIFSQDIANAQYTFSEGARMTYEYAVRSMEIAFGWMLGEDNEYQPFFNRAVLESFKYAIFYHQLMKKDGTEIDSFSLEFGLRVARYNLCSLSRYLNLKGTRMEKAVNCLADRSTGKEEKIFRFVRDNPEATTREICRKFHLDKASVGAVLRQFGRTCDTKTRASAGRRQ